MRIQQSTKGERQILLLTNSKAPIVRFTNSNGKWFEIQRNQSICSVTNKDGIRINFIRSGLFNGALGARYISLVISLADNVLCVPGPYILCAGSNVALYRY